MQTSAANVASASSRAGLAAARATAVSVDAAVRVAGMPGREPRGRTVACTVLVDSPLEKVRLIISPVDQPGNHGFHTVDRAVNPPLQLGWHLGHVVAVEICKKRRFREVVGSFVISEIDDGIELILGQGDLDVVVDGRNGYRRVQIQQCVSLGLTDRTGVFCLIGGVGRAIVQEMAVADRGVARGIGVRSCREASDWALCGFSKLPGLVADRSQFMCGNEIQANTVQEHARKERPVLQIGHTAQESPVGPAPLSASSAPSAVLLRFAREPRYALPLGHTRRSRRVLLDHGAGRRRWGRTIGFSTHRCNLERNRAYDMVHAMIGATMPPGGAPTWVVAAGPMAGAGCSVSSHDDLPGSIMSRGMRGPMPGNVVFTHHASRLSPTLQG